MADEGEFPKVDGDILYGSEASSLARVTETLNNPTQKTFASTAWIDAGSFVLSNNTTSGLLIGGFLGMTLSGAAAPNDGRVAVMLSGTNTGERSLGFAYSLAGSQFFYRKKVDALIDARQVLQSPALHFVGINLPTTELKDENMVIKYEARIAANSVRVSGVDLEIIYKNL